MTSWYFAAGSQTQGPVSEDELRSMAQRGELNASSYVVKEGETVWQTLADAAGALRLAPNATGGFSDLSSAPPVPTANPTVWGGPPASSDPGAGWGAPPGGGFGQSFPGPSVPGPSVPGPNSGWTDPNGGGAGGGGAWGGAAQPWGQPAQPGGGGGQPGWGQPDANPYAAPAGQYTPWSPTATGAYGVGPGALHPDLLAGWGTRFLAKVIDTIIILVPAIVLVLTIAIDDVRNFTASNNGFQFSFGGRIIVAQLLGAIIGFVYLSVLNGQGQTLGKKVLGIRVVNRQNGQPLGTGKGFLRHLTQFIGSFLSCFGLLYLILDSLWPLWDGNKQALHDKVAGSVVIKAG